MHDQKTELHIGVQVGAHTVFDEGAEHIVKHLSRTCRATALHVYAMNGHAYAPWFIAGKQLMDKLPVDHGAKLHPRPDQPLTTVWFKSDGRYYERPEHAPAEPERGYGDRDVFDELAEPTARAGVELYARLCDWGNVLPYVPGMMDWAVVDSNGVRQPYLCANNPGYRRWTRGLIEDVFRGHPYLAGLNFGLERGTALMQAIKAGGAASCFCDHCLDVGGRRGIRVQHAKAGFAELAGLSAAMRKGQCPPDGAFCSFWRIVRNHPEVLMWDKIMTDGWFDLCKDAYAVIKAIDPSKQVGWHILQHLSFNPFYRAMFDLAEWAPFSDWIKPVLYHNCAGERMKNWFMGEWGRVVFGDMPSAQALEATYAMLGYEGCDLPGWSEMESDRIRGFTPAWVEREVRRCIKGAAGAPIYAGIGLDIPHTGGEDCAPESAYACSRAALKAGARGLVVSREYCEMRTPNLEAVGRAVEEFSGL